MHGGYAVVGKESPLERDIASGETSLESMDVALPLSRNFENLLVNGSGADIRG